MASHFDAPSLDRAAWPRCVKVNVFQLPCTKFFLWRVTFWRCRDLQAWFVSRTRFLARNFNSLCVCCSLSESRSFLLYFTIPGDISCCLCSEMGRTKAELRAKKKMLQKRATKDKDKEAVAALTALATVPSSMVQSLSSPSSAEVISQPCKRRRLQRVSTSDIAANSEVLRSQLAEHGFVLLSVLSSHHRRNYRTH